MMKNNVIHEYIKENGILSPNGEGIALIMAVGLVLFFLFFMGIIPNPFKSKDDV